MDTKGAVKYRLKTAHKSQLSAESLLMAAEETMCKLKAGRVICVKRVLTGCLLVSVLV